MADRSLLLDADVVAGVAAAAVIVAAGAIAGVAPEYESLAGSVVSATFAAVILSPWLPGVEESVLSATSFGVLLAGAGGFALLAGYGTDRAALFAALGAGLVLWDQHRRRRRTDASAG